MILPESEIFFIVQEDMEKLYYTVAPEDRVGITATSQKTHFRLGMVSYACNTSYSEGRDQKGHSIMPA
jgi:hypothetical protein